MLKFVLLNAKKYHFQDAALIQILSGCGPPILPSQPDFDRAILQTHYCILTYVRHIYMYFINHYISELAMEVELLVNSHHCQTSACNTEGISSILKLAQMCTHALAEANEYQLMVR